MTWPGWGDILPSVMLLATIAALLWAVVRLLVQPVAERAASEAEKRSAASTRLAVDGLYDRLKGNDFRHVEDGLKGPRGPDRRSTEGLRPTPQGGGTQLEARHDRARQDRKDMEGRLMAAIVGKPPEGP